MSRRLSPTDRNNIARLYAEEGFSVEDLCVKFCCSGSTVRRLLRNRKLMAHTKPNLGYSPTPEEIAQQTADIQKTWDLKTEQQRAGYAVLDLKAAYVPPRTRFNKLLIGDGRRSRAAI